MYSFIHDHFNTVADSGPSPTSSSDRVEGDDSEDESSTSIPTIIIGVIAGIAIIALIVIGVILTTCYLKYVATYKCLNFGIIILKILGSLPNGHYKILTLCFLFTGRRKVIIKCHRSP